MKKTKNKIRNRSFMLKSKSLIEKGLDALLNPIVVAATITTLLGTVIISLATNEVTKQMKERELQVAVVTALMDHTQKAELKKLLILENSRP